MVKCEICNKEFNNYIGLGTHIKQLHKITSQEYYNKYIKTENEGKCVICNKKTTYRGLKDGYLRHCSKKCCSMDIDVQDKFRHTMQEKYNTNYGFTIPDTIKKAHSEKANLKKKQTYIKHYNVDNPAKATEIKEKIKQTNIVRYGVVCNLNLPEVKQKAQSEQAKLINKIHRTETNIRKYGVENCFQRKDVVEKNHSPEVKQKIIETKRKNGTFNTSKPEDEAYEELVKIFGVVKRQYKSEVYPFLCDFYIPSEDLYIELNLHWTHGFHWFDENSKEDQETLEKWKEKAKNSKYYQYAIDTWTVRDVEKRQIVEENKINYLVFWSKQSFYDYIKEIGVEH